METPEFLLKLPRERLYERVATHIQDVIVAGDLEPGDKLPSETELCGQFGVSRTVIREAMKSLEQRGLLSIEPGRGTFVSAMSSQALSDSFGLFIRASDVSARNLIEVREHLEVKIAELAAERAKPENLAKMEQAIEEMDKNIESVEEFIRADLDFHMAVAEATQNDVFLALVGSLIDEMQDIRRVSADVPDGFDDAQYYHKAIYECVKKRDKEGAAEVMQKHLHRVCARYMAARLTIPDGKVLR